MSSNKCARCDKTVYPVEGLRCLDKLWHKGCFKCQECNMTLNMKNYKGFEKRPYCNAHCPQAKATTVADTPEIRRLAENTRIQSQAKYHEDFEKSKGKGFTTVADDPETRRIRETSKNISNVAYHKEFERKQQMDEKRSLSGANDDLPLAKSLSAISSNNNNQKMLSQNIMQHQQQQLNSDFVPLQHTQSASQIQQHQQVQQQRQLTQQQQLLQKQQLLKQQQHYVQQNGQSSRQSGQLDASVGLHQMGSKHMQQQQPQHYPQAISSQQQQQQLMMRHQQQQQMVMQQQQQRQLIESNAQLGRQSAKQQQAMANSGHPSHIAKNAQIIQAQTHQQQIKYVPINDSIQNQAMPPSHLIGVSPHHHPHHQMLSHSQITSAGMPLGQRVGPNAAMAAQAASVGQLLPSHHQMMAGYNPNMNGGGMISKQQHYVGAHTAPNLQMNYPNQMPPTGNHHQQQQMRPISGHHQHMQQVPLQVPRRVFRAMYDYVANDVDEVSFFENDLLIDCVNVDRNWLIGKVARSGQTGMLPANYVVELSSH